MKKERRIGGDGRKQEQDESGVKKLGIIPVLPAQMF
jgi:hypothetical protein